MFFLIISLSIFPELSFGAYATVLAVRWQLQVRFLEEVMAGDPCNPPIGFEEPFVLLPLLVAIAIARC